MRAPARAIKIQTLGPQEVHKKTLEVVGTGAKVGNRIGRAAASDQPQQ
jgi:hypothetical protein